MTERMHDEPPPLPRSRQPLFRELARYSWASLIWCVVVALVVRLSIGSPPSETSNALIIAEACFFGSTGLLAGGAALSGVRRWGWVGLLIPATIGVGLWLLVFVLAGVGYAARKSAAPRGVALAPAIHSPAASPVEDARDRFSFDLPLGYVSSNLNMWSKYGYAFEREVAGERPRLLLVQPLDGPVPRLDSRRDAAPASPRALPMTFLWRGLRIDGARISEGSGPEEYLTFNILIPLRRQAMRLEVGGSASAEPQLRSMIDQILASFEGETNW